jgi:hypothetical protein
VLKALHQSISSDDFDNLERLKSFNQQACPHKLSHLRHEPIRHPLTVDKEALYALVKEKESHDHHWSTRNIR